MAEKSSFMRKKTSFMRKKIEFQGGKSSFSWVFFGKIEFHSKSTKDRPELILGLNCLEWRGLKLHYILGLLIRTLKTTLKSCKKIISCWVKFAIHAKIFKLFGSKSGTNTENSSTKSGYCPAGIVGQFAEIW